MLPFQVSYKRYVNCTSAKCQQTSPAECSVSDERKLTDNLTLADWREPIKAPKRLNQFNFFLLAHSTDCPGPGENYTRRMAETRCSFFLKSDDAMIVPSRRSRLFG
jgi:hypothetical protein